NELVLRGFNVRGAVRDLKRAEPLREKIDKLYGPGHFELTLVKDGNAPNAYDAALDGVQGVIHFAIDVALSFGPQPTTEGAIKSSIDMALGILKAATKVPTIKAVVVTSSVVAHAIPSYGKDQFVSVDQYNEEAVKIAYSLPPDHPAKGGMSYFASKTVSEQELWKWVDETKPSFAVNTVLPHLVLGKPFNPAPGVYSTSSWLSWFFDGNVDPAKNPMVQSLQPCGWFVDVRDQAIIHIAALLASDTNHQKLWAAGSPPVSINDVLDIWRKNFPDRKFPDNYPIPESGVPKFDIDREKETQLLKRYAGRDWIPLEESLLDNVKDQA
ncbi:hypothetical protein BCR39DRAFT_474085, partial [Naematelia encephala]